MSAAIRVNKPYLLELLESRKMGWADLNIEVTIIDERWVEIQTREALNQLCSYLDIPISLLFKDDNRYPYDLDDNIKIGRKDQQFERVRIKDGQPMYHYRHMMKTTADPHLMALRTSPLCDKPEMISLNKGHLAKELVYVTQGQVKMYWQSKFGHDRTAILNEGDSVYLAPWVPHAFSPMTEGAEILAIDFH
jgi:mannose-6-phosphate isomerase-like protein (cupin superfamily)